MGRIIIGLIAGLFLGVGIMLFVFWKWLGLFSPAPALPTHAYGRFLGEVKTKWLDDGRSMELLEDFGFSDPNDLPWLAPKGAIVDGASIPKAFWSLIGGPFEGKFRNASVVHDVACDRKDRPCADVHRMFYFACRAGGIEEPLAKTMYWAVAIKGPQWKLAYQTRMYEDMKPVSVSVPVDIVETQEVSEQVVAAALQYFKTHELSLDQIQALDEVPAK